MNDEPDFEDWSAPQFRLRALDTPKHSMRLISACLLGLAVLAGFAWLMLRPHA